MGFRSAEVVLKLDECLEPFLGELDLPGHEDAGTGLSLLLGPMRVLADLQGEAGAIPPASPLTNGITILLFAPLLPDDALGDARAFGTGDDW